MPADTLQVARSLRVPGLGLLILPAPPAPAWLTAPALHTALALHLHRPDQPALPLIATVEEISLPGEAPVRALLLDADPPGEVTAGAWLEWAGELDDPYAGLENSG